MRDEWFPYLVFPIGIEQFHQLPKSPIYKWEYWDGKAHLTARPKAYHCVLDLQPTEPPETIKVHWHETVKVRPLREDDWPRLVSVFAGAFGRLPPLLRYGG